MTTVENAWRPSVALGAREWTLFGYDGDLGAVCSLHIELTVRKSISCDTPQELRCWCQRLVC